MHAVSRKAAERSAGQGALMSAVGGASEGVWRLTFLVMMKLDPMARLEEMASANPMYLSRCPASVMGPPSAIRFLVGHACRLGQPAGGE